VNGQWVTREAEQRRTTAEALRKTLRAIEQELFKTEPDTDLHYTTTLKLSGRLAALKFAVDFTEYAPTAQAVAVYDELAGKIDAQGCARRIARGGQLTVDGRRVRLVPTETALAHPAGAGGLKTTRFEVVLRGPALEGRSEVEYRDTNYANRIGWKEVLDGSAPSGARGPCSSPPPTTRAGSSRCAMA